VGASVVCISRTVGAGGEEVGRLVAERLGFGYVDVEIVKRAAEKGHVSPEDVADAERRRSTLRRLFEGMGRGSEVETYGLAPTGTGGDIPDDMRALIREAIEETAGQGQVVILAHGASFALEGLQDMLRVLVTASPGTRARRFAEAEGLAPGEAERVIKDSDTSRTDYLRRFYGVKDELPTHYDLVVNTDAVSEEQAADLVVRAAGGS
jgi:cytidylate kinase